MSETNDQVIDESKIAELVAKQVEEKTQGILENKNTILGEKKELQIKYEELKKSQEKFENFDLDGYNEYVRQKKLGELKGQGATEDLANLQLQFDQKNQDLESVQKQLEASNDNFGKLQGEYHSVLKKQAVLSAMSEYNFKKASNDILLNHLLSSADVRTDGESIHVIMTKDGVQKTPKDFMTEFVQTDTAKDFLLSNQNSGGGGQGGVGTPPTTKSENPLAGKFSDGS